MLTTGDNWRNRLFVAVAYITIQEAHKMLFVALPNNDGGQLLYHGAAVLSDFWLMVLVSQCLSGRIVLDLCALSFASMVANAVQWLLYVAYFPPTIYNVVVTGVGYAQLLRLMWAHRDLDYSWRRMARSYGPGGAKLFVREGSR
jgi:hypothetical protein